MNAFIIQTKHHWINKLITNCRSNINIFHYNDELTRTFELSVNLDESKVTISIYFFSNYNFWNMYVFGFCFELDLEKFNNNNRLVCIKF